MSRVSRRQLLCIDGSCCGLGRLWRRSILGGDVGGLHGMRCRLLSAESRSRIVQLVHRGDVLAHSIANLLKLPTRNIRICVCADVVVELRELLARDVH